MLRQVGETIVVPLKQLARFDQFVGRTVALCIARYQISLCHPVKQLSLQRPADFFKQAVSRHPELSKHSG
jgi:hypothetical protein